MTKSFHLDRRLCLKSAGVALALPMFESMSRGAQESVGQPRRMCAVMFPYGVAVPKDSNPERNWGWFPQGKGADYKLTNVLKPLEPLMSDVSIFGGLSHPRCRTMNGHDTGDTFLTANNLNGSNYDNTVSLDQFIAHHVGDQTRIQSLTLSSDGGIGPRTRSTTMSYTMKGRPIPALSSPRAIFDRMFGHDNASKQGKYQLETAGSILDHVLDQTKSLRGRLGRADRMKLDEYETSVRDVERRVDRAQSWLSVPMPAVDPSSIQLEANPDGPKDYIKAMYDLMYLALQTDMTRVITYQIGSYGPTIARTFPTAIGGKGDWHALAHAAGKKGGAENLGRFDQFLAQNLADFLQRLKNTPDGDSNLLDSTLVLYGSSNSQTHQNHNYPLLLAGGGSMGLKHNHYLTYGASVPMSNLFVSMLQAMGIEADRFSDSTGTLTGV